MRRIVFLVGCGGIGGRWEYELRLQRRGRRWRGNRER